MANINEVNSQMEEVIEIMTRRAKALPKILAIARAEDARLGSAISEQVFSRTYYRFRQISVVWKLEFCNKYLKKTPDALITFRYGPLLGGRLQLDPVETLFQFVTDTGGEDRLTKNKVVCEDQLDSRVRALMRFDNILWDSSGHVDWRRSGHYRIEEADGQTISIKHVSGARCEAPGSMARYTGWFIDYNWSMELAVAKRANDPGTVPLLECFSGNPIVPTPAFEPVEGDELDEYQERLQAVADSRDAVVKSAATRAPAGSGLLVLPV